MKRILPEGSHPQKRPDLGAVRRVARERRAEGDHTPDLQGALQSALGCAGLNRLEQEGPENTVQLYLHHLLQVQQGTGIQMGGYLPMSAPPSWTRWVQPYYRVLWAEHQRTEPSSELLPPAPDISLPDLAPSALAPPLMESAHADSASDTATTDAVAVQRRFDPAGGDPDEEWLSEWFHRTVTAAGPGRSPTEAEQSFLTRALGTPVSYARIHEGGAAQELSSAVSARAFTVGRDIFLPGGVHLDSPESAELLAHEAAHVLQAAEGRLPSASGPGLSVSDPAQTHEREAESIGRQARSLAGSQAGDAWGLRDAPVPDQGGQALLWLMDRELPDAETEPPVELVDELLGELTQDRLLTAVRDRRASLEAHRGGVGSSFARQMLGDLEARTLSGDFTPSQIRDWTSLAGTPDAQALSEQARQAPYPRMGEALSGRMAELSGPEAAQPGAASEAPVMRSFGGRLKGMAGGAAQQAMGQAMGGLQSAMPPQVTEALGALQQLAGGGPQQIAEQLLDAAGVDTSMPGISEHLADIQQAVGQVVAPELEAAVAAGEEAAEESAGSEQTPSEAPAGGESEGGGLGGAIGQAAGAAAQSPGVGDAMSAVEGGMGALDGVMGEVMGQLDVGGLTDRLSGELESRLGDALPESVRGLLSQGLAEGASGMLEQATGGAGGGGGGIGGAIGGALGGAAGGAMPDVGGALEGLTESLPNVEGLMEQAQSQMEALMPESVSGVLGEIPGVDEIRGLMSDPGALTDRLLSQVGDLASLPEVMQNWTEIQQVVRDVAVPDLNSAVTAGESAASSEGSAGRSEGTSTASSDGDTASTVQTAVENRLDPATLVGPLREALEERLGGALPAGVLEALSGDLAGGAQALVGQAFGVLGSLGGDIPGVGGLLSQGQEALGGLFRSAKGSGAMEPMRARSEMARSGSRPLPADVASRMGAALGEDLSGVRVHADAAAARASEALGANAFAAGAELYFGAGRFSPSSASGEHLLAHELAHVVQAARGGSAEGVSRPGDSAEREADFAADRIIAGEQAAVGGASTPSGGGPAVAPGMVVFGAWINDEQGHAIRDSKRMTIPPDKDTLATEIANWCDDEMTDSRAQSLVRESASFNALWTNLSEAIGDELSIIVELVRDEQGAVRSIRVTSPDVIDSDDDDRFQVQREQEPELEEPTPEQAPEEEQSEAEDDTYGFEFQLVRAPLPSNPLFALEGSFWLQGQAQHISGEGPPAASGTEWQIVKDNNGWRVERQELITQTDSGIEIVHQESYGPSGGAFELKFKVGGGTEVAVKLIEFDAATRQTRFLQAEYESIVHEFTQIPVDLGEMGQAIGVARLLLKVAISPNWQEIGRRFAQRFTRPPTPTNPEPTTEPTTEPPTTEPPGPTTDIPIPVPVPLPTIPIPPIPPQVMFIIIGVGVGVIIGYFLWNGGFFDGEPEEEEESPERTPSPTDSWLGEEAEEENRRALMDHMSNPEGHDLEVHVQTLSDRIVYQQSVIAAPDPTRGTGRGGEGGEYVDNLKGYHRFWVRKFVQEGATSVRVGQHYGNGRGTRIEDGLQRGQRAYDTYYTAEQESVQQGVVGNANAILSRMQAYIDRASQVYLGSVQSTEPTQGNLQYAGGQGRGGGDVHKAAREGVQGGGGQLPNLARIQESFGQHDISGVSAHSGGAARDAAQSIGASAYATGEDVAFGRTPDLHTAAHEAAHVIQQRQGVNLSGGVGKAGDTYERHADTVADAVVQGESAEGLLGQNTAAFAAKASGPVQRQSDESGGGELVDRAIGVVTEALSLLEQQLLESESQGSEVEGTPSPEAAAAEASDQEAMSTDEAITHLRASFRELQALKASGSYEEIEAAAAPFIEAAGQQIPVSTEAEASSPVQGNAGAIAAPYLAPLGPWGWVAIGVLAVGSALLLAAATTTTTTTTDTDTTNRGVTHRGRLQVQGTDMREELSFPWAQSLPMSKAVATGALLGLKATLSRGELRLRDQAFARALLFISMTLVTAPPPVSRTFQNRSLDRRNRTARVDIEIWSGMAFL